MMAARRIAFIVQRYGRGGAEYLCQVVAERLAGRYDVSVLTTCAIDHETWANHFPPGESIVNGVRVVRFPTAGPRGPDFAELSTRAYRGTDRQTELAWLRSQGPHSPALLHYLASHRDDYDAFFFVTYLYEPTVLGLPLVAERAALISTAHDEPPIRLSIYRDVFTRPRAIFYLSPAERRFVQRAFANTEIPSTVCSCGLAAPRPADGAAFRRRHRIDGDLLVYVGRVEGAKGCGELVDWVREYRSRRPVTLALIGQNVLRLAAEPGILPLGFIDDDEKDAALAAATVFVNPSAYESFSFVALEAWQRGCPVLANRRSEVLRDHIIFSQGGLYYDGRHEFGACLDYLLDHPTVRAGMGRNGARYVAENYAWERVDATYDRVIDELSRGRASGATAGTG